MCVFPTQKIDTKKQSESNLDSITVMAFDILKKRGGKKKLKLIEKYYCSLILMEGYFNFSRNREFHIQREKAVCYGVIYIEEHKGIT